MRNGLGVVVLRLLGDWRMVVRAVEVGAVVAILVSSRLVGVGRPERPASVHRTDHGRRGEDGQHEGHHDRAHRPEPCGAPTRDPPWVAAHGGV